MQSHLHSQPCSQLSCTYRLIHTILIDIGLFISPTRQHSRADSQASVPVSFSPFLNPSILHIQQPPTPPQLPTLTVPINIHTRHAYIYLHTTKLSMALLKTWTSSTGYPCVQSSLQWDCGLAGRIEAIASVSWLSHTWFQPIFEAIHNS